MPAFERKRFSDTFDGVVLKAGDAHVLAKAPLANTESAHTGTLDIRYGVKFLERPFISIVPELIALDYGDWLNGEEAWDFLFNRSNLYPRADVVGYLHDGTDEMIPLKKLDIMRPVTVLAYANADATTPLAELAAYIGAAEDLPAHLRDHLPQYASLKAWQNHDGTGQHIQR